MPKKKFNYSGAFKRNLGLITKDEQKILKKARIAIPGMGGVGGISLITLARLGVGSFNIADDDSYEIVNMNREYGAKIDTLGKRKAKVMEKEVLCINPTLKIRRFNKRIDESNIDDFLKGVDLVIDGVDFFSIESRRLIFRRARELGIHVITAGPVGFSSAMLVFSPTGMTFDRYMDLNDKQSYMEKLVNFAVGLAPASTHFSYIDTTSVSLEKGKGPSAGPAIALCAGISSIEALKILLKRGQVKVAPYYRQFDAYRQIYRKGYLCGGNRNPIQRIKRFFGKIKFGIK